MEDLFAVIDWDLFNLLPPVLFDLFHFSLG